MIGFAESRANLTWGALAAMIYAVPVLGGWVTFGALLLGIGALVWQGWPRRDPGVPNPA